MRQEQGDDRGNGFAFAAVDTIPGVRENEHNLIFLSECHGLQSIRQ